MTKQVDLWSFEKGKSTGITLSLSLCQILCLWKHFHIFY